MTDSTDNAIPQTPSTDQGAASAADQPAAAHPGTPEPNALPQRKRRQATAEEIGDRKIKKWSEILETVVLTVATLATVWAGYQASQWNSIQSSANVDSIALRIESSRLAQTAQQMELADVTLFTNWVNAVAAKDQPRADFYAARFRADFKPAFARWVASEPLKNPNAAASPFELPEYHLAMLDEAKAKEDAAAQQSQAAVRAGTNNDQFTMTAVILAGSLLLAGLASRFDWEELRGTVVAVALLVLLFSILRLLTLPIA